MPVSSSCEMSHLKVVVIPPPGTYVYMAPEMIRHEMYDQKADVYSWGVLLVECLRQQPPYEDQYLGPVDVRLTPCMPVRCWQNFGPRVAYLRGTGCVPATQTESA